MAHALDAYARWLSGLMGLGVDQAVVGSKLIVEIADLRARYFAKASTRVTELPVGHTKLSTLWLERQRMLFESDTLPPKIESADYERLVERQRKAIEDLRAACGLTPQD